MSAVLTQKVVTMSDGQPESASDMEAQETVSTGTELMQWLESHKNTGGMVKLSDSVVLDGYYCFCPNSANTPSVFVDTGSHTITVSGEVELWSTHRLVFSGQTGDKGIFCVEEGGMLTLSGVAVEGSQCALWQEEGSGLIVDNCRVSGDVHYAQTPFVMSASHICAVVQKGQTAADALPVQVKCVVNRQGQASYNESLSVSWNLEGTEKQQKERLRFLARGSFFNAVSKEPLQCTVAFHDYPLTFTEVKAAASKSQYLFRGSYMKPENDLPITVISEYSFDGMNWTEYDKKVVSNTPAGFFIGLTLEQWDIIKNPYIYIRLRWDDGGKQYFSNVLRYAATNLDIAEDQGGTRGGGTSIVNPPDTPQEKLPDGESQKDQLYRLSKPVGNEALEKCPTDRQEFWEEEILRRYSSDLQKFLGNGVQDSPSASLSKLSESDTQQSPHSGLSKLPESGTQDSSSSGLPEGSGDLSGETPDSRVVESSDSLPESSKDIFRETMGSSAEESFGSIRESSGNFVRRAIGSHAEEPVLPGKIIAAAIGITMLSFLGGAAVFCLHAGIFANVFHGIRKSLFKS